MKRGASLRQRRRSALLAVKPLVERGVCPHPGKKGYGTKAEAKLALRRLRAFTSGRDHVQPYACACGLWHLGHKPRKTVAA